MFIMDWNFSKFKMIGIANASLFMYVCNKVEVTGPEDNYRVSI
jgi:hypothetical protein